MTASQAATLRFLAANKPFLPHQSAMCHISQAVRSDDDSGTSTDISYIFSNEGTDDESLDSAPEQESDDDLEDDSDDDSILDDEDEQEHPAAYYLKEAECLNVSHTLTEAIQSKNPG